MLYINLKSHYNIFLQEDALIRVNTLSKTLKHDGKFMDRITQRVLKMYQQYPFPGNVDYKTDYSLSMMWFFTKFAPKGKKSILENTNIMEAGCGTGNTLIKLARMYPSSKFTGIDMTPNSLRIAKKNAAKMALKNISFIKKDILKLNLSEKFDVIFCIGVLHHLADIEKGFKNLIKHLKNKGYLVLWLYGKYGRFRLNLNQMMLKILLRNIKSLPKKIKLTKKILKKTNPKYIECHFNVPDGKIENKWPNALNFILNNDIWLVDQFLHYNEKTVSMNNILNLSNKFNMKMIYWNGISESIEQYINNKEIIKIFNNLSRHNRLLVLDYLLKPNYYFVILKK